MNRKTLKILSTAILILFIIYLITVNLLRIKYIGYNDNYIYTILGLTVVLTAYILEQKEKKQKKEHKEEIQKLKNEIEKIKDGK